MIARLGVPRLCEPNLCTSTRIGIAEVLMNDSLFGLLHRFLRSSPAAPPASVH